MADHAISPSVPQPPIRLINDAKVVAEPFWFLRTPRVVYLLARALRDGDITQVFCAVADNAASNGQCWRTHTELADDAGLSERKTRDVLSALVEAGILTTARGRFCNSYTIPERSKLPAEDAIDGIAQRIIAKRNERTDGTKRPVSNSDKAAPNVQSERHTVPVTRHQTSSPPARNVHQSKNVENKTKKTTPQTPQGASEDDPNFTEFWTAYPKKRAKGDARKAFKAAKVNGELLARMLAAIDVQRVSEQWTKAGGQFIPYPASWIRDEGWEDVIEVEVDAAPAKQLPRHDPDSGRLVF